jgi:hypothetical protein
MGAVKSKLTGLFGARSTRKRNFGSAGRREVSAILKAERRAKKYSRLSNLEKPKTFKNYLARGYYGIKGLFTRKSFANRVASAERKRDSAVRKLGSAVKRNQSALRAAGLPTRSARARSGAQRKQTSAFKRAQNELGVPKPGELNRAGFENVSLSPGSAKAAKPAPVEQTFI